MGQNKIITSKIDIGKQNFKTPRMEKSFYVNKTDFIRQWLENKSDTTAHDAINNLCIWLEKYYGKKQTYYWMRMTPPYRKPCHLHSKSQSLAALEDTVKNA